ncbi:MAG TPA: type II secretion system protein [Pirellulales bacterium]|jgi:prepilin-type N-terminal cleavage/methylation domain-containing protein|nr:type II secretion system protein [Pirellulales bacterium]
MKKRDDRQAGFTLVELIVVVAILALLAAMVLPRFDTLLHNAGHVAGASSMADANQLIQAWYTSNRLYPDGWDTRLDSSGTLLPASTGTTLGLPTELVGSTGRLTTTTLTSGDVLGFINVGITTLYSYDSAPLSEVSRPDDRFNTANVMTAGGTAPTVAIIDPSQAVAAGTGTTNKIIDHIYRQNLVVGGTPGTVPTGVRLVAFGLGAHNSMVAGNNAANLASGLMVEAPVDGSFNSAIMYNRLIVVFAVTPSSTTGAASSVVFAGVFGADGDLVTDDAAAMNSAIQ